MAEFLFLLKNFEIGIGDDLMREECVDKKIINKSIIIFFKNKINSWLRGFDENHDI